MLIGAFAFGSDKAAAEDGEDALNVGARLCGRRFFRGFPFGSRGGVLADVGGEDLHNGPVVARGVVGDALEGVDGAESDLDVGLVAIEFAELLDGLGIAVGDVTLLHDLDGLVAGAGALPSEVEDEKAEDAEDDLGESFAELVFQFKLFGPVVLEGGVHGTGDFLLGDDPDDPEGEDDGDGDSEDCDENVRGGAVGVFGPEAYLFDSLMEGLAHVDGSLAFAAGGFGLVRSQVENKVKALTTLEADRRGVEGILWGILSFGGQLDQSCVRLLAASE